MLGESIQLTAGVQSRSSWGPQCTEEVGYQHLLCLPGEEKLFTLKCSRHFVILIFFVLGLSCIPVLATCGFESLKSGENDLQLKIFSMKRSGHHAVMNWIVGLFDGAVYHLDSCSYAGCYSFSGGSAQHNFLTPREDALFSGARLRYVVKGKGEPIRLTPEVPIKPTELAIKTAQEVERSAISPMLVSRERDAYLMNFEDFNISLFGEIPTAEAERGHSLRRVTVIIFRDPANWLASRIRHRSIKTDDEIINRYKAILNLYQENPHYLGEEDLLFINYNRWFADISYRRELAKFFQRPFTDRELNSVSIQGGGSSTDGGKYDGSAQQMNVLGRWLELKEEPVWWKSFQSVFERHPDLRELSRGVFDLVVEP